MIKYMLTTDIVLVSGVTIETYPVHEAIARGIKEQESFLSLRSVQQ